MQDFVAFLRLTAIGLIILLVAGVLVSRSILGIVTSYGASGPVLFALLATLVGLLVEPLLRHHPLSSEVRAIYDHVKAIMIAEVVTAHGPDDCEPAIKDLVATQEQARPLTPEFWNVVAKSVYDYLIFTFPGTDTYMRRVNQQIRIAYFYILIWYVYRASISASLLALAIKSFAIASTNPIVSFVGAFIDLRWINSEILLGRQNILELSTSLCIVLFLLYFPARFFLRVGLETMSLELYSRHIVVIQNRAKIAEITHQLMRDEVAMAAFGRRTYSVKTILARKPLVLGYWILSPGRDRMRKGVGQ